MTRRESIPIYDIKGKAIPCGGERKKLEIAFDNRVDRYITQHLVFERRPIGEVMRAIFIQGMVIGAEVENKQLVKEGG